MLEPAFLNRKHITEPLSINIATDIVNRVEIFWDISVIESCSFIQLNDSFRCTVCPNVHLDHAIWEV